MGKEIIDENLIKYLAGLSRINLEGMSEKMTGDLREVVDYFEVLKEVDVEGVEPVSGGTDMENVVRKDEYQEENKLDGEDVVKAFPEEKDGYLRVPPVFE